VPDSNPVKAPSVQSDARNVLKGAMSADLVQIRALVAEVMSSLRAKQKALRKRRDIDYNLGIAQQQLRRLSGLHSELQKIVDAVPIEDSEVLSDLQARSAQIQTQLSELASHWTHAEGILPNKKSLKRYLRDVLLQLQSVLNDVETELAAIATAKPFVDIHQEIFDSLSSAIARENQQVELGDFGRSRKSELLEKIHLLALQIYRFRQLTTEPRLKKKTERFEGIALQIQDTVNGLDIEEDNAAELLDSSTYVLERQLCQLEFNGRLQFFLLPAGWFVNRYKDITRLQSVQSRVLSGLALSLIISGFTFSLFTLILTSASALASVSQNSIRKAIDTNRAELADSVQAFVTIEEEKEQEDIRATTVQAKIDEVRERLEQEDARPKSLSAPTDTPDTEEPIPEPAAEPVLEGDEAELARLRERQAQLQDSIFEIENERQRLLISMEERLENLSALTLQSKERPDDQNLTTMTRALYDAANFLNQKELLNHLRRILLAAFSGAVGSMMSILIRLEQMDKEGIKNPFLLGALKPLLGAVFGVAVFAILSTGVIDIFPASFSLSEGRRETITGGESGEGPRSSIRDPLGELDPQELYTIFLVAFIAGFSERLASDTLKSVSSKGSIG